MKNTARKTLLLLLAVTALIATVALCACDRFNNGAKLSATFDDSHKVYVGDSLDDLKPYFTVTYTDKDGATIDVTDFTLSGTLAEGKCIVAVSYNGLSQKVTVTVLKKSDQQQPKEYTVTFKADGTTVGTATYTAENKNITEPTVPAKTGYTGTWKKYTLAFGDVTVNAVYTAKQYTVTLDYAGATGGNGAKTLTVTYDQVICALPVPTKDGAEFAGWKLNGKTVTSETVWKTDGNATLTALWLAPTEGLEYELNSDGKSYSVKGIGTATDTSIVIPSVYDNLPVTNIGGSAFRGCGSLMSITLPESVTSIDYEAFEGCNSLTIYCKAASRPSDWYYRDHPVVWNCNENNLDENGYMYALINGLRYALKNGEAMVVGQPTNIVAANIPEKVIYDSVEYSVTNIATYAFSDCSGLISINVSSDNINYHSTWNCLIETDTKTLIAGCKNSVIPTDGSVTSIGESAINRDRDFKKTIKKQSLIRI